jgi:predicted permease
VTAALSIAVGSITIFAGYLALLDMTDNKKASNFSSNALLVSILHSFRRPVVWSPVLALVFVAFGAHALSYLMATLKTLGSASTRSALLLTGLVLSAQRIKADGPVVWSTVGKLVLQPLLAIALCLLFHLERDQVRDIAVVCAVPAGFFGLVFGKQFHATPQVASSSLITTYVFSVFTLPLWLLILR